MRSLLALCWIGLSAMAGTAPQATWSTGGHRINVARNATVVSTLVATDAVAPLQWALVSGSLPPGITLDVNGSLAGTSSLSGDYTFRAEVTDANGAVGAADFVLTVNPATLAGSVQSTSFVSAHTGLSVPFTIYLPPGYATGDRSYPVVFHLHGIGGSHNGNQINSMPMSHEAAVMGGLVREAIIVFPDGFNDSFWADSANSPKPAETHVMTDLLPWIDSHYRTVTAPGFRIISGFSMGGFGAAKFATKYPGQFQTATLYDGALLNWTQIQNRHPVQAAEIFANDASRFDAYSPWRWLQDHAGVLADGQHFRVVAAALEDPNRAWRDAMTALNLMPDYVETGLPHAIGPIFDAQGANGWAFIESRLAKADHVFTDSLEGP